jgi:hypothetical protein
MMMNRRPYQSMYSQPFDFEKQMEKNRQDAFHKDMAEIVPYKRLSVMISHVSTMIYDITNLQDLQHPKIPKVVKRGPMYYIPGIHKNIPYITIIWELLRNTELFKENDAAGISATIQEMSIYFKELMERKPEELTEQEYSNLNTLYDRATTLQATLKEVQDKHKPIAPPPVASAPAQRTYTPYVSQTLTGGRTRRKKRMRTQRKLRKQHKQRKQTQRKQTQRKQRKQRK